MNLEDPPRTSENPKFKDEKKQKKEKINHYSNVTVYVCSIFLLQFSDTFGQEKVTIISGILSRTSPGEFAGLSPDMSQNCPVALRRSSQNAQENLRKMWEISGQTMKLIQVVRRP